MHCTLCLRWHFSSGKVTVMSDSRAHKLKQLLLNTTFPCMLSAHVLCACMACFDSNSCDIWQVAFDSQVHELKQLLSTEARLSELRSSISGLAGDSAFPQSSAAGDAQAPGQLPAWTPEEVSCFCCNVFRILLTNNISQVCHVQASCTWVAQHLQIGNLDSCIV